MRILLLTHRLPYAPNRGDRIRAFHLLKFLRTRGEVDVLSLVHDREERASVSLLDGVASSVHVARVPRWRNRARAAFGLLTRRPVTFALLDSTEMSAALAGILDSRRPDVVLAYCSSMARYAMEGALRDIPFVLDMVDVDSEKWRALGVYGAVAASTVVSPRSRGTRAVRARGHQVSPRHGCRQ